MEGMTIKEIAGKMELPVFTARVMAAAKGMPSNFNSELNEFDRECLILEIQDRRMIGGGFTDKEIGFGVSFGVEQLLEATMNVIEDDSLNKSSFFTDINFNWKIEKTEYDDFIYFVQEGHDGPIKIGTTQHLKLRLSSLQTGSARRLKVLGTMRGGKSLEILLHKQFAEYQVNGEWFQPSQALLDFITKRFGGHNITEGI